MSQAELPKLRFDGNILADKYADQLAALKTLFLELRQLGDEPDKKSLEKVSKQLVDNRILKSRDSGVQAYGACCLNEILKIHAPDAPYTVNKLVDIFGLFIKLFRHLSNQNHPYFKQIHLLIENMVQIHVIALVGDLPNAESLITTIFTMFYEMANDSLVPGMDIQMASILSQIIEYYENPLPEKVVNLVLSNFLSFPKRSKDSKNASLPLKVPVGYTMSKTLCTDNVDIMVRYTNQFFSNLLHPRDNGEYEGGEYDEDEEDFDMDFDTQDANIKSEQVDNHQRTTTLLVEIWKAVPELLAYVVGQLQQDLQIDDLKLRLLATDAIGQMITHSTIRGDFVRDHHAVYNAWLSRVKDRSAQVRIRWTERAGDILALRSHVTKDLVTNFINRIDDTDERVRIKACNVAADLEISAVVKKIAPHCGEGDVLGQLAGRLRDKKAQVRVHGFQAVGNLYNKSIGQHGIAGKVFSWVPTKVFEQVYLNDKAVNELIDETEFKYIFPKELDDSLRTQWILTAVKNLNEPAFKSFEALSKRQVETARYVNLLLVTIKKKHDDGMNETINRQLNSLKKFFGDMFSNSDKIAEVIDHLANSDDKNLRKLIGHCVNPDSDYKQVTNALNEVLNRCPSKLEPAFRQFLYRASYLIYNKSILKPIVELCSSSSSEFNSVAHTFLKQIASHCPVLLSTQASRLTEIIQNSTPGEAGTADTLKTANLLFNKTQDNFPQDKSFIKAVFKFCVDGTPAEAKQAVKLLNYSNKKEMYQDKLMEVILNVFEECDSVQSRDDAKMNTKLATLAQLTLSAPQLVEQHQETIIPYLIKNFIITNENPDQKKEEESPNEAWVDDEDLDEYCWRKILALRVFVNRIRAHEGYENVQEMAKPVFSVLFTLIGSGGEISKNKDTPAAHRVRLRCEAGLKLLKLGRIATFDKMIKAENLNKLVLLLQEEVLQVRSKFVRTLTKYLSMPVDGLPDRYIALVFMMAYEVDDELYNHVTTWIRAQFARQQSQNKQQQSLVFEKSFARLLSLAAHHQDYLNDEEDELDDLVKILHYLLYYLSLIANSDNISLIFYIAQRVKQYMDYDEDYNEKLWLMSDLGQFLVLQLHKLRNWTVDTWPGKILLDRDAFHSMPDSETSRKVAKTAYLDEDYAHTLEVEMKKSLSTKAHGGSGDKKSKKKNVSVGDESDDDDSDLPIKHDDKEESDGEESNYKPATVRSRSRAASKSKPKPKRKASSDNDEPMPDAGEDDDEDEEDAETLKKTKAMNNGNANGRRSSGRLRAKSAAKQSPEPEQEPEDESEHEPEPEPTESRRSKRKSNGAGQQKRSSKGDDDEAGNEHESASKKRKSLPKDDPPAESLNRRRSGRARKAVDYSAQ